MNAERLHHIVLAIKKDFRTTKQIQNLKDVMIALKQNITTPNNATYQDQLSKSLIKLHNGLNKSTSNTFSPGWKQIISEIGGDNLFGPDLSNEIRTIFNQNKITFHIASNELSEIQDRLNSFNNAANLLVTSFNRFNIGYEDLEYGKAEFGIFIPREAIDNNLLELNNEIHEINLIFMPFNEIITGSRPEFKISTISSSDFTIYIETVPIVAAGITVALSKLISIYKQILEIKILRNKLREQDISKKALEKIDKEQNEKMKKGIEIFVKEFISKYEKQHDKSRLKELTIELKFALNKIANRIDKGYHIDIRVPPILKTKKNEDKKISKEEISHIEQVLSLSSELKFQYLEGEPILSLPEKISKDETK